MAVQGRNPNVVNYLVSQRANIDATDKMGWTALGYALYMHSVDAATSLYQTHKARSIGSNIKNLDSEAQLKLNHALRTACNFDLDLVKSLVSQGADVNFADNQGSTPLKDAIWTSQTNIVDFLIEQGADMDAPIDGGWTALGFASYIGNAEAVTLLKSKGAKKYFVFSHGDKVKILNNLLNQTCTLFSHVDNNIIRSLIESGADVNNTDAGRGLTPMHIAAVQGRADIMKILFEKNANTNVVDENGWAPFGYALVGMGAGPNIDAANYLFNLRARKVGDRNIITSQAEEQMKLNVALFHALGENGNPNWVKLLVDAGAKVNNLDAGGVLPLSAAVFKGDIEIIEFLLQQGATNEVVDQHGWTPYGYSLGWGNFQAAELLQKKGAKKVGDKDLLAQNPENQQRLNNALVEACGKNGNLETVKALVDAGANVSSYSQLVLGYNPLGSAAAAGHLDIVEYLVGEGVTLDAIDKQGWAALGYCVRSGRYDIADFLLKNGASRIGDKQTLAMQQQNINQLNKDLPWVCGKNGNLKLVKLYLDAGADVNSLSNSYCPLRYAAGWGHLDIIEELCARGANLELIDDEGLTPLGAALKDEKYEAANLLFKKGAKSIGDKQKIGSNKEVIEKLDRSLREFSGKCQNIEMIKMLLAVGIDINTVSGNGNPNGHPALLFAAGWDRQDIIRFLISQGAKLDIVDKEGWTPLGHALINSKYESAKILREKGSKKIGDKAILSLKKENIEKLNIELFIACSKCDLELIKLLIDAGAETNSSKTQSDKRVFPVLGFSATYGHVEILDYLIAHGADIEATNSEGKTPLTLACEYKYIPCINTLLKHGADINKILPSVYDKLNSDIKHILYLHLEKVKNSRPPVTSTGLSALNEACKSGELTAVKQALANGSKPDGQTLTRACLTKNMQIIDAVLAAGAKPDDKTLTSACSTGIPAIVYKALGAGAQPNEETYRVAAQAGNEILNLLPKKI